MTMATTAAGMYASRARTSAATGIENAPAITAAERRIGTTACISHKLWPIAGDTRSVSHSLRVLLDRQFGRRLRRFSIHPSVRGSHEDMKLVPLTPLHSVAGTHPEIVRHGAGLEARRG